MKMSSPTSEQRRLVEKLQSQGKDIISLSAGQFEKPLPKEIADKIHWTLENCSDCNLYLSAQGHPVLTEKLKNYNAQYLGLNSTDHEVLVCNGAKSALFATLSALFCAGEKCLRINAGWPTFAAQLDYLGIKGDSFTSSCAESVVSKIGETKDLAFVLVAMPSNPEGTMFDSSSFNYLVSFCKLRNIVVILDSTYHRYSDYSLDICHEYRASENLIVVNSFSKTLNITGLRLGWVWASKKYASKITSLLSHVSSNSCSLIQHAFADTDLSKLDDIVNENRKDLRINYTHFCETFGYVNETNAGFYVFPNVGEVASKTSSNGDCGYNYCTELLEGCGVSLMPGGVFDCPERIRVSLCVDRNTFQAGIARILNY